ncbi:unnamed protein product [Phytophthora fragariaefolia]|uniref:Unnamed protein product n=1 Tax=Phytophthora fragariaefolia TaxID=1490495 RepID=A0A9W6Y7R2_9STRA|nr:unnamed protein product [Phytophthora fragariaefolia]
MWLGDYKKTRGNALFARDELEALFDIGSDADMEDGEEEDKGTSSSTRVDPSVGSRRPREGDSDASSSKRSRSSSDRPLTDAGPLSSPRSGGDSTSSGTVASRNGPVRDPWMPTPSEIQSRFGSTAPPSHSDGAGIRRLPVEAVPEWQALCQSWSAFVENFNKDPAGYRERVRLARERYERFSKSPKLHDCTGVQSKRFSLKFYALRRLWWWRASYSVTISGTSRIRTFHRGSEEILSNEYENDQDLGSGSDDQQLAGRSSELPPVRLAVGVEAAGRRRWSGPPDSVDRLEAFNSIQTAEFAALRQELALLKAHIAQVSQTASSVQVDLGLSLSVL